MMFDGFTRGERVAVVMPSGLPLARVLRDAWDAGVCVVPLDPAASSARNEHVAKHAGVIARADERGVVRFGEGAAGAETDRYVLYTSGSTAAPKGVVLSAAAVERNARAVATRHGFAPDRPHASWLPLHHCNAICGSLIGCHLTGAEFVVFDGRFDAETFFDVIALKRVRTAAIVPALLERIVDEKPLWPASLDYLYTAAAPLSSDLARRFYDRYGARLVQGYGMTEAVNFTCTMPKLDDAEWVRQYVDARPPVGVPIDGCEVRIDDRGEVLIAGPVMDGYWRAPDDTRATMRDGWIRTGDLGEWRGPYLVLNGRVKDVLNVGGETRSPLEIEEEWSSSGVHAVAFAVDAGDGTDRIGCAFPENHVVELEVIESLPTDVRPDVVSCGLMGRTSTGKPQRVAARGVHPCIVESDARYRNLLAYAGRVAILIAARGEGTTPESRAVHAAALAEFARPSVRDALVERTAAHDALDAVLEDYPNVGPHTYRRRPGLWERLMVEWPMGQYAELMARFIENVGAYSAIEFGAGVGNTTRKIRNVQRLIATDGSRELCVRRGLVEVNFDGVIPDAYRGAFDVAFATNAVHCSIAPAAALANIASTVRPGGFVAVAEGAPRPGGRPWALEMAFAPMGGWYDRGGFRSREEWFYAFRAMGARDVGFARYRARSFDFGGLVWARI